MEVTRNYFQMSTVSEHTFPFPGGSLSYLFTVLPHTMNPKCWLLWGFLLSVTSMAVIGLPAHAGHISLSQAAPWWMDGCQLFHLSVHFEASLPVREYKIQVNCCQWRGWLFFFLASDVLSWTTYVKIYFFLKNSNTCNINRAICHPFLAIKNHTDNAENVCLSQKESYDSANCIPGRSLALHNITVCFIGQLFLNNLVLFFMEGKILY